MGDDAAFHQVDEKGSQASLYDVAPEHHDYTPAPSLCGRDGVNDFQEIPCDENVGKRFEERGETAIVSRR
jgi:hypothetical protein